jgi:two-component system sensor histidine kinase/response regulator
MRPHISLIEKIFLLIYFFLSITAASAQIFSYKMPQDSFSSREKTEEVRAKITVWLNQSKSDSELVSRIIVHGKSHYATQNPDWEYDYLLLAASELNIITSRYDLPFKLLHKASLLPHIEPCRQKWLLIVKASVMSIVPINRYEEACNLFSEAHQSALAEGCHNEAVIALMNRANLLEAPRLMYPQELKLKLQALSEARKYNLDSNYIAEILGSIGITHFVSKNYDLAQHFWLKQLQHLRRNTPQQNIRAYIVNNNLGLVQLHLGLLGASKKNLQLGLNQAFFHKDTAWIALLSGNLAKLYFTESQYDSAFQFAGLNYTLALANNLNTSAVNARILQAEILISQQEWKSAEALLEELRKKYVPLLGDFDRQESSLRAKSRLAEMQSKIEAHKRNYPQAYLLLKEHYSWQDSLNKMEQQSQISQLQAQFDFEQKENEILVLRTLNEAGLGRIKYQYRIIVAILIAAVFFLGIIGLLIWFYKRQRNFNLQLEESNSIIVRYLEELKLANRKLEDANQLKEKLIAIIGHDLRQPLIGLHNLIALVENHKDSALVREKSLPMASYKLSETMNLMDNLIVWAKQHSGGWSPRFEVLVLKDMVSEAFALATSIAAQKQVKLVNNIPSTVKIKTDRNVLLIVLRNLVANGLKFTLSGGEIAVSCQLEAPHIKLLVSDTGTGIDNEVVGQLFKQSGMSTPGTLKERGHGLGLMLCKDFVEKLGGNIAVESELGKGSCFSIHLSNVLVGEKESKISLSYGGNQPHGFN